MNICIDTETTGLLKPSPAPLSSQPQIIELCAIKFDDDGIEQAAFLRRFAIDGSLPPIITKITGITDNDLFGCKRFKDHHEEIVDFFKDTDTLVAHNATFDMGMLRNELLRISGEAYHDFPWPKKRFCTVEKSIHLKGYRLKLEELYKMATGKEHIGGHRAKNDVLATIDCYKWLHEQKK